MASSSVTEGTVLFAIEGVDKKCETWYKIHGSLDSSNTPLIVVHGGPGLTHDYLQSLSALHDRYSIPVILYDQIGNGRSTHLQEKAGDEEFWVDELFWLELENLVSKLGLEEWDLLGHSWGGMVGATFAGRTPSPKGCRKLILSNSPSSMAGWTDAYKSYLPRMLADVQEVLRVGEETQSRETPEYEAALMAFMSLFCCTTDPWPAEFLESFDWAKRDPTVSLTMCGPSEFETSGNRRDWSAAEAAKEISVPTLVINGTNEGASDASIKPFLDSIKDVEYVKFSQSTHMPMYEERDKYLKVVGEWLLK